jgi:hypothetical protein
MKKKSDSAFRYWLGAWKWIVLGVVIGLLATACASEPAPGGNARITSNPEVAVDILFEVDGYRVYRFLDAGEYRYFVTPAGLTTLADHDEYCGKGCVRTETVGIPTLEVP